jgi:hypothetical protein
MDMEWARDVHHHIGHPLKGTSPLGLVEERAESAQLLVQFN